MTSRTISPLFLLRFAFLSSFALLLCAGLGCSAFSGPTQPDFYLGGIQVNEPDHDVWAQSLASSGMNTVSVTVYAHQGDWDTDTLWYDPENPSVVSEIRAAKKAGLSVILIMRVALDHAFERNEFLWHGMIMPKTPALRESWFRKYSAFVTQWARLAEEENVDVFAIGSELNSLTSTRKISSTPPLDSYYLDKEAQKRSHSVLIDHTENIPERHLLLSGGKSFSSLPEYLGKQSEAQGTWVRAMGADDVEQRNARRKELNDHWLSLIRDVRKIFRGKLSYAANFDQYHEVQFWSHLDLIGINAYFPLRGYRPPGQCDDDCMFSLLKRGWAETLTTIKHDLTALGVSEKPIVFTELGYTFRRHATLEPWAMDGFSVVPLEPEKKNNSLSSVKAIRESAPEQVVVWREEPIDYEERAIAIRALREASKAKEAPRLKGLLYWKLSTVLSHRDIEPFVVILSDPKDERMKSELAEFVH